MKRHLNHLCTPGLNMLPLHGLPGLPETRPKLKGYRIGLLAMYITHTVGTAVSHHATIPQLGNPQSCRFNMHLCIIYKMYYNLAMFPLLDFATPATVKTQSSNIKFILRHCSKDVFKHFFLLVTLRSWNALPQSAVEATSLELFKASLPSVTY